MEGNSIGSAIENGAVPRPYKLDEWERKRELTMMQNPRNWPLWPFLPVKQPMSSGLPRCGVLVEMKWDEPIKPIVYDCIVHMPKSFDPDKKIAEYNSFEEMLEAGWVVD